MGRITSYEQGQLASHAVGTPGINPGQVDTSGIELANTIGRAAEGVQQEANRTLAAQQAETLRLLRQKQAEARAAAKQLEEAKRSVDVATYKDQYNQAYVQQSNEIQVQGMYSPDGTDTALQNAMTPQKQQILDGIVDPLTKAKTQAALTEADTSNMNSHRNWMQSRVAPNALSQVQQIGDNFAVDPTNSTISIDEYQKRKVQFGNDNAQAYYTAHGATAQLEIRKVLEQSDKKRLTNIAATGNDAQLQSELKVFDADFHGADKQQFLTEIHRIRQEAMQQQRLTSSVSTAQHKLETLNMVSSAPVAGKAPLTSLDFEGRAKTIQSDPTLTPQDRASALAENLSQKNAYEAKQKADLAQAKVKAKEEHAIYVQQRLNSPEAGQTKKAYNAYFKTNLAKVDTADEKSISKVNRYMDMVQGAYNRGYITDTEFRHQRDNVVGPMLNDVNAGIKARKGNIFDWRNYIHAHDKIDAHTHGQIAPKAVKTQFANDAFAQYQFIYNDVSTRHHNGGQLTPAEVEKAIDISLSWAYKHGSKQLTPAQYADYKKRAQKFAGGK